MNDTTEVFERQRRRLQGIAYRMLGSVADSEDVVQDVWLRFRGSTEEFLSPEAWLVTVTTRLSIDRLRAAKKRREAYFGLWLPEPVLTESPATPEQILERFDDVSVAFLILLERLEPEARAAFLLREVFDADYDQVAETIGKTEAACRQIVNRAKVQLQSKRPVRVVSRERHLQLMRKFADALARGDFATLHAMLAEDAEYMGDGGGKVPSIVVPLLGGKRIAQLFHATYLRFGDAIRVEFAMINGQWGLLRFVDGKLESSQSYETDGERIVQVHVQRNADKLARMAAAFKVESWAETSTFTNR